MALLDRIKTLADRMTRGLAGHAARVPDLVIEEISRQFPGLNVHRLMDRQIPIPAIYLESELVRRTADIREIENIRLQCEPGHFVIALDTRKGPLAHKIQLRLTPVEFSLTRHRKVAIFLCEQALDVQGRNLLGSLSSWIAQGVLISTLRSKALERRVGEASQGAVELAWPRITVHLDRIDRLKPALQFRVLGYSLSDVLRFGPLQVEKDFAFLGVDWATRQQQTTQP